MKYNNNTNRKNFNRVKRSNYNNKLTQNKYIFYNNFMKYIYIYIMNTCDKFLIGCNKINYKHYVLKNNNSILNFRRYFFFLVLNIDLVFNIDLLTLEIILYTNCASNI